MFEIRTWKVMLLQLSKVRGPGKWKEQLRAVQHGCSKMRFNGQTECLSCSNDICQLSALWIDVHTI